MSRQFREEEKEKISEAHREREIGQVTERDKVCTRRKKQVESVSGFK